MLTISDVEKQTKRNEMVAAVSGKAAMQGSAARAHARAARTVCAVRRCAVILSQPAADGGRLRQTCTKANLYCMRTLDKQHEWVMENPPRGPLVGPRVGA